MQTSQDLIVKNNELIKNATLEIVYRSIKTLVKNSEVIKNVSGVVDTIEDLASIVVKNEFKNLFSKVKPGQQGKIEVVPNSVYNSINYDIINSTSYKDEFPSILPEITRKIAERENVRLEFLKNTLLPEIRRIIDTANEYKVKLEEENNQIEQVAFLVEVNKRPYEVTMEERGYFKETALSLSNIDISYSLTTSLTDYIYKIPYPDVEVEYVDNFSKIRGVEHLAREIEEILSIKTVSMLARKIKTIPDFEIDVLIAVILATKNYLLNVKDDTQDRMFIEYLYNTAVKRYNVIKNIRDRKIDNNIAILGIEKGTADNAKVVLYINEKIVDKIESDILYGWVLKYLDENKLMKITLKVALDTLINNANKFKKIYDTYLKLESSKSILKNKNVIKNIYELVFKDLNQDIKKYYGIDYIMIASIINDLYNKMDIVEFEDTTNTVLEIFKRIEPFINYTEEASKLLGDDVDENVVVLYGAAKDIIEYLFAQLYIV